MGDILSVDGRGDMIGLNQIPQTRDEWEHQRVLIERWQILATVYNDSDYRNFESKPETVKELLVRYVWLSYFQLPDYKINASKYLRWNVFQQWLESVSWHHGFGSVSKP